jgi:hypothetical protein
MNHNSPRGSDADAPDRLELGERAIRNPEAYEHTNSRVAKAIAAHFGGVKVAMGEYSSFHHGDVTGLHSQLN